MDTGMDRKAATDAAAGMPSPTPTGKQAADQPAPSPAPAQPQPPPRRRRKWPYVLGALVLAVGLAIALFDWNWFKPLVEARASAALGRKVTIGNLHVALGWTPRITADGVHIANPADWPGGGDFATIDRLDVDVDARAYLHGRQIVIPAIALQHPVVEAAQLPDGSKANWEFDFGSPQGEGAQPASQSSGPKIGALRIADGKAHVVAPKLAADFAADVATREEPGKDPEILVDAKGTYARQPITGRFIGGALLSLRDETKPYPVNLQAANGPTRISLVGTLQDPFELAGANLKLELSGPDMRLLLPLTGIPIPQTPPYKIAGNLAYAERKIRFTDFTGQVGSSDLGGSIAVDPTGARPVVEANLHSRLVDLDDLAGFIGSTPGRTTTPGQSPEQRREVARAEASSRLLPDAPINLPKLNAADVHLAYKGDKLRGGRSQPLDNIEARMDIVDGKVELHPLAFGIGRGQIRSNIALSPVSGEAVHARADIEFRNVDVARLLQASGVAQGAGVIGGRAAIDGQGRSLAQILGTGNGEVKLFMRAGGNVSALLVDLAGLQFGNAVLSALGVPTRAQIQCLISDSVLQRGQLSARTFILDTSESRVTMAGQVNLANEAMDLRLRSEAKHFTVGSLNTPINVGGSLKNPSIRPDLTEAGLRAGAAVGLGIVATPLAALLPTIEFGTGEDNACGRMLGQIQAPPRVPAARTPTAPARGRATAPRRARR